MLDNSNNGNHWKDWIGSEGKLLRYNYFLGNQRVISTQTKPFLVTDSTQIQIGNIITGESIEVILGNYRYIVNMLIHEREEKRIMYKSGKRDVEYIIPGGKQSNFLRGWFSQI